MSRIILIPLEKSKFPERKSSCTELGEAFFSHQSWEVNWRWRVIILQSLAKSFGLFWRSASYPVCLPRSIPSILSCAPGGWALQTASPSSWPLTSAWVQTTKGSGRRSEKGWEKDQGISSSAPCFSHSLTVATSSSDSSRCQAAPLRLMGSGNMAFVPSGCWVVTTSC